MGCENGGREQIIRANPQLQVKLMVSQRPPEMLATITHQVVLLCLHVVTTSLFSLHWAPAEICFRLC